MNPYEKEGYLKPVIPYVQRSPETEKLHKAEENMIEAIFKTTQAFRSIFKTKGLYQHIWKEALPEVLVQALEGFDRPAAELAAIAFLEKQGYTITK